MAAEMIAGYGPQMLSFLNVSATLLVLFGIFRAGMHGGGTAAAGLWAAALWSVLSGSYALEARDPNTEVFINACLAWSFALLIRAEDRALGWRSASVTGILFALGSLYKPIVVINAVLFVCVHVLWPPKEAKSRKQAIADACLIGAIGLAVWAIVFGYFALTGRFEIFWETIITYNRYYSGNPLSNLVVPLKGGAEILIDVLRPLAVFALIGSILTMWVSRRAAALMAAFIISTWIAVALPGPFYPHYYQLWLPPLVIGTVYFISLLPRFLKPGFEWLPHSIGAILLLVLALQQLPAYRIARDNDWSKVVSYQHASAERTAQKINALLEPDETFFVWGSGAITYFWSSRRPPTAVFDTRHMMTGPLAARLSMRVEGLLASERPELFLVSNSLVDNGGYDPLPPDWLAKFLAEQYFPLEAPDPKSAFRFYVRRIESSTTSGIPQSPLP
jgi:4-amino-4-deoxy-L-arabinose transferase-like glycosyltransferase